MTDTLPRGGLSARRAVGAPLRCWTALDQIARRANTSASV